MSGTQKATRAVSNSRRRAANGQGSRWYDERRQRYVGQISVRDRTGKLKRRTVFGRTQAERDTRLDALRKASTVSPTMPASPSLARFMTYWLEDVLPLEGLKPKTINGYADTVRLYIDPVIGRIPVADLTAADVRRMLMAMMRRGLAPNTQRIARSTLRRALRTAEADGLVTRNVAALVDGVDVPKPVKGTLTTDEARRLLEVAASEGDEALVAMMLGLGLRRGETLGLRWDDVRLDADRPTMTVAGQLTPNGRGQVLWHGAKADSERTLHLPTALVDVLRRHRAAQAELDMARGTRSAFVFTNDAGNPRDPDRVTRQVKALAAAAGLGHWTPHGMRHSAASILIAAGVPLKVVSEMLGHSSIRVTADIYGHLMEPARAEAAEAMQKAIFT
jgi:integrase